MERPLLFAETPRAGRWNHRFLVPDDSAVNEERLAEQASRARQRSQGADYLAVVRQVQQHEGGRTADELLVLQGIDVEHLDAATRRVLMQRLEQRLDDLEQLVQAMDWEQEGKRLVVRRQELSQWFADDFADELAACRGPAPIEDRIAAEPEETGRVSARLALPLAGAIVLLVVLMFWRPWSGERPAPGKPDASKAAPASRPMGRAEQRELEAPLRQLAEQWRLPERGDDFPKLCEAVVEKLERDFAMQEPSRDLAPEQRLEGLVDSLSRQLLRPSQQSGAVRARLEDNGFQSRLMSIYVGQRLDYAAPLRLLTAPDDYDRQQQLRSLQALCPARTKQQVREFRALAEQARELTLLGAGAETMESDSQLVRRLHDAGRSAATLRWPVAAADAGVAILGEQDAGAAGVLVAWMTRAGFVEVSGGSEAAVVSAMRGFAAQKRDFLEALSQQDPPGRRVVAIHCARLLLQLDDMLTTASPDLALHSTQ